MQCDIRDGRCLGPSYNMLLFPLTTSSMVKPNKIKTAFDGWSSVNMTKNVGKVCPNKDFTCDDDETCCPLDAGEFGCCPLGGDAVCCEDKGNTSVYRLHSPG